MDTRLARYHCGINLGNSLDAYRECGTDTEAFWRNPRLTRDIVRMYADAGFDILRLPVTWGTHMDAEGNVAPEWMARVHEVVDWALQTGVSVILNAHHENKWLCPELSRLCDVLPRFSHLWRQIAVEFAAYGDELLLQGANEPNLENSDWDSGTRDSRAAVNALNHTFVRTVRETGGNNAARWLMIPTLAARTLPECLRDLIAPKDDHLILTMHSYAPRRFVFSRDTQEDTAFFDEKARDEVREIFMDIKRYALPHGLPIMLTEFGAVTKLMPDGVTPNDAERVKFVNTFMRCAGELGIPCIWWDNNYYTEGDEFFGLYDRRTLACNSPAVAEAVLAMGKESAEKIK